MGDPSRVLVSKNTSLLAKRTKLQCVLSVRLSRPLEYSQVVKATDFDSVIGGSNPSTPASTYNEDNIVGYKHM